MAIPSNRVQFAEKCLRELGAPVIQINVDDEHIDDCIDDALQYWHDYHFDGSNKVLIRHQVTSTDKTNKYIEVSNNVIGVSDVLPLGAVTSYSSIFNFEYQVRLNDLYQSMQTDTLPYYMARLHFANLDELFVGKQLFRYNRHINRVYIDMDWSRIVTGNYVILDATEKTDPNVYADVWGDRWLLRYCTQLIKRIWASELTKFEGIQLMGGIQFNATKMYDDAVAEIEKLENEMITNYSIPPIDFTA